MAFFLVNHTMNTIPQMFHKTLQSNIQIEIMKMKFEIHTLRNYWDHCDSFSVEKCTYLKHKKHK